MDPLDRFAFSQSSLQDFVDCRHRFQLRYLQHVAWPAVQAEPARENEQHMQRGERFHRLAQQYLLGVPEEKLTRMAEADEDGNLLRWWRNFLECIPANLIGARQVEVALEAGLSHFRLIAKYDLLLLRANGCVTIYDWKTAMHRPSRAHLLERLQTRIYPYLLVQAGALFNQGKPFLPEQVEMIYWFAEPDQAPEHLNYTQALYTEDDVYLHALVEQIASLGSQDFSMSETEKVCRYCVYRSLCRRGVRAGELAEGTQDGYEPGDAGGLNFDLEQIGEISF